MIDRIRHDIQQRLEQLLAEADKLRHALVALDPRDRESPTPKATTSQTTARQRNTPEAVKTDPGACCQRVKRCTVLEANATG